MQTTGSGPWSKEKYTYNIVEFFRIRYTEDRIYLLDYERLVVRYEHQFFYRIKHAIVLIDFDADVSLMAASVHIAVYDKNNVWADLNVKKLTEPQVVISEIDASTASIKLYYRVQTTGSGPWSKGHKS